MTDFSVFSSRLLVIGELVTRTALHVGAGRAISPVDPDLPVIKDLTGHPVIPGSSLKGAIRGYLAALLQAVEPVSKRKLVCDQDYEQNKGGTACVSLGEVDQWRQEVAQGKITANQRDTNIIGQLCLSCRVFGSPWMAAKVKIQDAPVVPSTWHRPLIRDGVAIDRDKGTAADKAKFDYEAVPAGTRFQFKMQIDNATNEERGLAMLAIQALKDEQILIGGMHRAGAGWCKLDDNIRYLWYETPEALLLKDSSDYVPQDDIAAVMAEIKRRSKI